MQSQLLLYFFCCCLVAFAQTLTCLPPRTRLPLATDCDELIEYIRAESLRPRGDVEKKWGRRETESATSAELPKIYYIFRGPRERQSTCLLRVDAWERPHVPPYDILRLRRILVSAVVVVNRCLRDQASEGWDFPGENRVVYVKLQRASALSPLLQSGLPLPEGDANQSLNVSTSHGSAELRVLSGQTVLNDKDLSSSEPLNETNPQSS